MVGRQVDLQQQGDALIASVDPPAAATETWSWRAKTHGESDATAREIPGAVGDRFADLANYVGKEVQATFTDTTGQTHPSPWVRVQGKAPSDEERSPWPQNFAVAAGIVAVAVLVALGVAARVWTRLRDSTDQASTLEALPGQVAWPLLTIGAVVLALGLWMVVVEWRGTFAAAPTKPGTKAADPVKVLELLSKLKGATLVSLVGLVILLAPAWIAGSAGGDGSGGGTSDDASTTTAPGEK